MIEFFAVLILVSGLTGALVIAAGLLAVKLGFIPGVESPWRKKEWRDTRTVETRDSENARHLVINEAAQAMATSLYSIATGALEDFAVHGQRNATVAYDIEITEGSENFISYRTVMQPTSL